MSCIHSKSNTKLNNRAKEIQSIIDQQQSVKSEPQSIIDQHADIAKEIQEIIDQQFDMTPKQFVATVSKRKDPGAWLDEVENQVKLMRKELNLTDKNMQITQTIPPWFDVLRKSNEVKCKSRSDLHPHFTLLLLS